MGTNENVYPLEENWILIDKPSRNVSPEKRPLNSETLCKHDSSELKQVHGASNKSSQKGNFFESAFAKHRFGKDVEELTICRNSTFLPHAQVSFHLYSKVLVQGLSQCDTKSQYQKYEIGTPKSELSTILCDIEPREGAYQGMRWEFELDIPATYPFHPPIIRCVDRLFHPNVEIGTGAVALKILNEDWSPVLTLRAVVLSLVLLFVEPNMDCIYNLEAADLYRCKHDEFVKCVRRNIAETAVRREKQSSSVYRRKKRNCVPAADPEYISEERPMQRVHYNPIDVQQSISGKRNSANFSAREALANPTSHLVHKFNRCQLGCSKRTKFSFDE